MHSLQICLSFEYKCSIFLVEMNCIIFQNKFEVGRNMSQPFYLIMNLALQHQPIRSHTEIWDFGPIKSANHISACHYGFLALPINIDTSYRGQCDKDIILHVFTTIFISTKNMEHLYSKERKKCKECISAIPMQNCMYTLLQGSKTFCNQAPFVLSSKI